MCCWERVEDYVDWEVAKPKDWMFKRAASWGILDQDITNRSKEDSVKLKI